MCVYVVTVTARAGVTSPHDVKVFSNKKGDHLVASPKLLCAVECLAPTPPGEVTIACGGLRRVHGTQDRPVDDELAAGEVHVE